MGREVKRVPLNWDWFERQGDKTWEGYILDAIECPLCRGIQKALDGTDCPQCDGVGEVYPRVELPEEYSWNKEEFGYQIWQNVSEGGPVSPVFITPNALAKWMTEGNNDTSITRGTSYEAWLKMIKEQGSTCSGIMDSDGFKPGTSLYEGD